jgi:serine/threonine protein kinase
MGRVFLGRTADGLPVAVKVIRADLAVDSEFRARFQQEVAAARKVRGTFTARVVDADLDGPVPWLATDFVAGPSLAEEVNGHGPLPVDNVLRLAAGLAEGLIAIHAAGVVHRDLKPANILLAQDGPRVIDFGISQAAGATATPGADFGSPRFMSPEHALGHVIGPPSDIFSLGAVLTFAATGEGPFGSGSNAALIYRLVNSPARLDSLPPELRELVGSCLAKHPEDRPTASRLLAQVGAIQWQSGFSSGISGGGLSSGSGISAAEPQPARAGRDLRRRFSRSLPLFVPGLLAAGMVATFLLSGGFAFSPAAPVQAQVGTTATPAAAQAQPRAVGTVTVLAPAAHVTVIQTASPSARQNRIGSAFATAVTVPSSSGPLAPADPRSSSTSSSSGSPSKFASPSRSASRSSSTSSSGSASPSSSSPSPSQSSSSS